MKFYAKIVKKAYVLFRDLGVKSSLKYLFARFILRLESVKVETKIGTILLRTNHSDIRVYYGCALEEYPSLKRRISEKICFYDFGGYTGLSAISAMKYLHVEKATIFEPVHANFLIALENLKNKANVEVLNYGLGDKTEVVKMNSVAGNDWGWSMFNAPISNRVEEATSVTLKTLSDIKLDETKKNFVKFDIEGAEAFLLKGENSRILKKFDFIFIEFHEERVPGITLNINSHLVDTHDVQSMGGEKFLFTKRV